MNRLLYLFLASLFSLSLQAQVDRELELARAWERDGQLEKALTIYQQLYEKDSLHADVLLGLKNIYKTLGYHDARRSLIQKQVRRDSLNIVLRIELADAWYRQKAVAEGEREVDRILSMKEAGESVYRLVASMLIENRRLDEVESVYRRARTTFKNENLFVLDMARLHTYRGDYYRATQELIRFTAGQSDLTYLESQLSQFPDTEKETHQVIRALKEYLQNQSSDLGLHRLLLKILVRSGAYAEAFDLAKSLDERLKRQGLEVLNFADQARGAEQFDVAKEGYEFFLTRYPQSPQAELGLAICIEVSAEVTGSGVKIADSLVSEKLQLDEAIRRFDVIIQKYPQTEWAAEALKRAGTLYLDRYFDVDQSLRYYRRLAREYLRSGFRLEGWLKVAECLVIQNRMDEARNELSEILRQGFTDRDATDLARFRIAEILFYEGRIDSVRRWLSPLIGQKSGRTVNDALELALVLQENVKAPADLNVFAEARRLVFQRRYGEALLRIDQLLERRSSLGDDACLLRAVVFQKQKKFDEAVQSLEWLTTKFEKSPLADRATLLKGEIAAAQKDFATAIRHYKSLLTNYPASIYSAEARKRLRELEGKVQRSS
jgi:tetratricopeptide (TPR) repeat protein